MLTLIGALVLALVREIGMLLVEAEQVGQAVVQQQALEEVEALVVEALEQVEELRPMMEEMQ